MVVLYVSKLKCTMYTFMICMVRDISLAPCTELRKPLYYPEVSELCNCGGLEEWTRPSFCPEAGPAFILAWPSW